MVTGGIAFPGSSGLGGELGGGLVVVAEHASDHGSGGLEDELADRGLASSLDGKSQAPEAEFEGLCGHGLSCSATGKEPSGVRVGGAVRSRLGSVVHQVGGWVALIVLAASLPFVALLYRTAEWRQRAAAEPGTTGL